jgi:hypothetical protein
VAGGAFLFSIILEYRFALLDVADNAMLWDLLNKIGAFGASFSAFILAFLITYLFL